MDGLLLIARIALAVVFVVAGIAKLLDVPGSMAAVRGFHLPERLVRPVGLGLPVVEIAAALFLLPTRTAWTGALAAALLLVGFLAGMVNSLRLGEATDCHCFGQLHSEPVGPRAIGRNATLLVVALFVLVEGYSHPGASPFGAVARLSVIETALLAGLLVALAGVAAEGWFIAHLLKQSGRFLLAVDELRAGAPAVSATEPTSPVGLPIPDVTVHDLDGRPRAISDLLEQGRRVMLVFSDPSCGPCAALRPEVRRWQTDHAPRFTIVVISRGEASANRAHAAEHGLVRVYLEADRNVSAAFGVTGTPAAVLISADGAIESEVAGGATAIRALVERAAQRPAIQLNGIPRPPAPTIGEAIPEIALPDLDGQRTPVVFDATSETVLLFWNPGCGFCSRLAPDILAWEQSASDDDATLVIVSTGDRATNAAVGFRSRVLLDEGLATGRRLGVSGTPSAVLVDLDGSLASAVAVGGPAVMRLLNRAPVGASAGVATRPAKPPLYPPNRSPGPAWPRRPPPARNRGRPESRSQPPPS